LTPSHAASQRLRIAAPRDRAAQLREALFPQDALCKDQTNDRSTLVRFVQHALNVSSSIFPSSSDPRDGSLPDATSRVVEAAVDLVRAEARLALSLVNHRAVHAITALLVVIVGGSLLQVAVALAVLAPALGQWLSPTTLAVAIAAPGALAAATLYAAFRIWSTGARTTTRGHSNPVPDATATALEKKGDLA
jgi:hypothetical protein